MPKRRLTSDGPPRSIQWALEHEHHTYPGAEIEIVAQDETDEYSDPIYTATVSHQRVVLSQVLL